jgi:glycerol-3-phosphate acyltransferase PlsY
MNFEFFIFLVGSYLFGAVPFGLLIARSRGVDLRAVGSGNIGATNVFRSVGKGLGLLTFALDALKGFLPAFLIPQFLDLGFSDGTAGLIFGFGAIAGHNWPVFLSFKGGKGVATSAGVLFAVAPAAALAGLLTFAVTLKTSKFVSLSSMAAALAIAALSWILYLENGLTLPIALSILAGMVVIRHRSNIERLRAGTESKIGNKA